MGLYVLQPDALSRRHGSQRAHLVDDHVLDLLRRTSHLAPPETLEIPEARMGAHRNAVRRASHRFRITPGSPRKPQAILAR
jgi:hypothetical protein